MPDQTFTRRVAILFGVLVALSFLVAALVIFIREGDWPARYVAGGTTILAAMFIAVRRRTRKR